MIWLIMLLVAWVLGSTTVAVVATMLSSQISQAEEGARYVTTRRVLDWWLRGLLSDQEVVMWTGKTPAEVNALLAVERFWPDGR